MGKPLLPKVNKLSNYQFSYVKLQPSCFLTTTSYEDCTFSYGKAQPSFQVFCQLASLQFLANEFTISRQRVYNFSQRVYNFSLASLQFLASEFTTSRQRVYNFSLASLQFLASEFTISRQRVSTISRFASFHSNAKNYGTTSFSPPNFAMSTSKKLNNPNSML